MRIYLTVTIIYRVIAPSKGENVQQSLPEYSLQRELDPFCQLLSQLYDSDS